MSVLNPQLFAAIEQFVRRHKLRTGVDLGPVTVANRGSKPYLVADPVRPNRQVVVQRGEQYVISCPFCGDKRRRLHFSCNWGTACLSGATKTRIVGDSVRATAVRRRLGDVYCYNEDCTSDWGELQKLADLIWESASFDQMPTAVWEPIESAAPAPVAAWPEVAVPLCDLPADHEANLYLRSRGFDGRWLGENLGVSWVARHPDNKFWLDRRIFIPIHNGGEYRGYQARCLGFESTPKYITAKNMRRASTLYNLDKAKEFDHCVLLEGPAKVWRFGPEAVASLGKKVSVGQTNLLAENWSRVYIALDPNAGPEARNVQASLSGRVETVLCRLPAEPDDMDMNELRKCVYDGVVCGKGTANSSD